MLWCHEQSNNFVRICKSAAWARAKYVVSSSGLATILWFPSYVAFWIKSIFVMFSDFVTRSSHIVSLWHWKSVNVSLSAKVKHCKQRVTMLLLWPLMLSKVCLFQRKTRRQKRQIRRLIPERMDEPSRKVSQIVKVWLLVGQILEAVWTEMHLCDLYRLVENTRRNIVTLSKQCIFCTDYYLMF